MSDLKNTVGFLQNVPLFHNLNNRQLEHLAKRMVEREFAVDKFIVEQGQGGEGFFIIVSEGRGLPRTCRWSEGGSQHLRPHRFFWGTGIA